MLPPEPIERLLYLMRPPTLLPRAALVLSAIGRNHGQKNLQLPKTADFRLEVLEAQGSS
jgi:hypothetical protein